MLVQQLAVLGNVAVIEVGNAKVEDNIKKKRKVQDGKIKPEIFRPNSILHRAVDPQHPKGLHQKVEEHQNAKVGQELLLHEKMNDIK